VNPAAVAADAGAAAPAPAVVRKTLPSGLRLIVREMPGASTVALDLRVRAGSSADDPDRAGAAHFIEHLVFKGTETRAAGQIDAAMEELGGEIDARTSRDWTRYAVTLPAGDKPWHEALSLLADLVLRPVLREPDVEAERAVIRAETAWARSEPLRLGYAELYAAAFGTDGDPYRLPLLGTEEGVARLTAADLRAFWAARYRPSNMTLAVAGDIRAADVVRAVSAAFPAPPGGGGTAAAKKPAVTVTLPLDGVVRAPRPVRQAERGLTTVLIGLRSPGTEEPDELPALNVLMPLLADSSDGGVTGGGRLFEALVTKQKLALSVSAEYLPGRAGGLIVLTATGRPRDTGRLEGALIQEMERLRGEDLPGDEEVARARASVLGILRYEEQTPTGAARRLALLDALDTPAMLTDNYAARLGAIRPDDVQRAAARYLTPLRYAVTVIGPTATGAASDNEVTP
jgi:zinc protease